MPLYEYQCSACGHRFEVIQKFSDSLLETCPKCGGRVHKLQSAPAFQFKGTGWYITDYAKKAPGTSEKSDASKTAGSDGKPAETKSDKGDAAAAGSSESSTATPSSKETKASKEKTSKDAKSSKDAT